MRAFNNKSRAILRSRGLDGEVRGEIMFGLDYARPSVSNMVEASASRLSLPAQTTNWKAW
jgi:hypothetical protein